MPQLLTHVRPGMDDFALGLATGAPIGLAVLAVILFGSAQGANREWIGSPVRQTSARRRWNRRA